MDIRAMTQADWPDVLEIYRQGIDSGRATFTTEYPAWESWDARHHRVCRLVACKDGKIVGFLAISPTSARAPYRGVAEVTVYVDDAFHGCGIGTALLQKLLEEAPKHGFWSLYSAILSSNEASIRLHRKCGFRTVGYRERIAKDRFGTWQDTTILEYRFPDE